MRRKIRVLVVDDSLLFRETLAKGLSADPNIEVVATASDPYMARDKIIEYTPDVMTLDVEMPKMSGIEFLRRLMPQHPIPVIVVSSISDNIFEALQAGAVDFVAKTDMRTGKGMDYLINEIKIKIKIASSANVSTWKANNYDNSLSRVARVDSKIKVIAMGASTGGTEAISSILKLFTRDIPGIVIVQHMPAVFTKMFADRLNNSTMLEVKEAEHGDKIIPGRAIIAAGDAHMRVVKSGSGYCIECYEGEKISGHCPSVDVLFDSTAQAVGRHALGVLLTGMGSDGARGMLAMRQKGARTLVQDEQSSVVYGMPRVAYELGAAERRIPLDSMAQAMYAIVNGRISNV